jgi:hypothetical protein
MDCAFADGLALFAGECISIFTGRIRHELDLPEVNPNPTGHPVGTLPYVSFGTHSLQRSETVSFTRALVI